MRLHVGLVLLLVPALLLTACGGEEGATTTAVEPPPSGEGLVVDPVPSRDALVGVLRDLLAALEAEDYGKALTFLVAFPGMSEEDGRKSVAGFIEKREISGPGIDALVDKGRFGSAEEVLGERAKRMADRAELSLEACYALALDSAEVAAIWDGSRFKLFRLNNVGKLE